MMDLSKSLEFFNPGQCKRDRIHIIGCGSVGSTVAENIARLGIVNISLYDFDKVEPHNIANQMFTEDDVGKLKTEALRELLLKINPDIASGLKEYTEGYTNQKLSGYVFLCVDSIELRREIATANKTNPNIKAMFDFRTRLIDAQHYAAKWNDAAQQDCFLRSMEFSHEEAKTETPVSACNVALSVASTVRTVCAYGVSNFMNYVNGGNLKKVILVDAFNFSVEAF